MVPGRVDQAQPEPVGEPGARVHEAGVALGDGHRHPGADEGPLERARARRPRPRTRSAPASPGSAYRGGRRLGRSAGRGRRSRRGSRARRRPIRADPSPTASRGGTVPGSGGAAQEPCRGPRRSASTRSASVSVARRLPRPAIAAPIRNGAASGSARASLRVSRRRSACSPAPPSSEPSPAAPARRPSAGPTSSPGRPPRVSGRRRRPAGRTARAARRPARPRPRR